METPQVKIILPKNIPEEIYSQHVRGEIAETEYHALTAAWVADNLHKYRPRYYPDLSGELQAYAKHRIDDSRDYSADYAKKLGSWVSIVMKIFSDNISDHSLLIWCKTKCSAVGLTQHEKKIDEAAEKFLAIKQIGDVFKMASDCQKIDARRSAT